MRCPKCLAEVGEVSRCPYCHSDLNRRTDDSPRVRGRFKGRARGEPEPRRGILAALRRFLSDPYTPTRSKLILLLAALYILLPLDFLPGGLIPVIGWLDDLVVAALTWLLIGDDVRRHYYR